jgi:hypothetical protein
LHLAISGAAVADTISQTGSFPDIADGSSYFSPGSLPTGFAFAEEIISGVDKFDPSLGTLLGVTVTAEFDSAYSLSVMADDVLDDSLPNSVDVNADFLSSFIGYAPGGGTTTYTLISADYSPYASSYGEADEGPSSDVSGESLYTSDSSVVSSLGDFDPSDFVGLGPVTALSAIIAIPDDALFFLDNVGSASAELSAEMYYLNLTVEYEYAPIPEPSTLLLAAVGLATVLPRRRQ